jgi:hypothetical protein
VNARTVLRVVKGRREEEGEEPVLCLRIPDEDDFEANHQIQKKKKKKKRRRRRDNC